MFDRIVVGYDGRDGSRDAVALAGELALAAEGTLDLIAVADVPIVIPLGAKGIVEQSRRLLAEALAQAPLEPGMTCDRHVVLGSPAGQLLEEAARIGADLIVVGASEHSAPGRVHLGSVGHVLLQSAACTVAVAPRGIAANGGGRLGSIAIGYDGGQDSAAGLECAVELARRSGARLRVLAVAESAHHGPHLRHPDTAAEHRRLEAALAEARTSIPPEVEHEDRVLHGDPARELAGAVDDADLLVVGSRRYGPVRRVVLGSSTIRLLRDLPCAALVVPRGTPAEHYRAVTTASGGGASNQRS